MEIQGNSSPSNASKASPTKATALSDDGVVKLKPGDGSPELQEYRLKLLQDLESVQRLGSPEFKNHIAQSDLQQAIRGYKQAGYVQERLVWENRLKELSLAGTSLAKAEDGDPESKKTDEWWNDWRNLGRPKHDKSISNYDALFKSLGLKPDSPAAKSLKALLDGLALSGEQKSEILGYLNEFAKDHGVKTLLKVCSTLQAYLQAQSSKTGPVDAKEVVLCALRDMAHPNGIRQHQKGTCSAAAIMAKLAAERPEQYVKMLTTLASGKSYKTPSGHVIGPNTTWVGDKTDTRSISEKIMQNAIMDQRGEAYDSKKDNSGMSRSEQEKTVEKVFGFKDSTFDLDEPGRFQGKKALWGYIQDDLARGRPVTVSFSGHAILVIGFDPTNKPPQVLIATWGSTYSMDLNKFLHHLEAVRSQDDSGLDNRKLPRDRKTNVLQPEN